MPVRTKRQKLVLPNLKRRSAVQNVPGGQIKSGFSRMDLPQGPETQTAGAWEYNTENTIMAFDDGGTIKAFAWS